MDNPDDNDNDDDNDNGHSNLQDALRKLAVKKWLMKELSDYP